MKKIIVMSVAIVVAFVAGFKANDYWYNNEGLFKANQFKKVLIEAQVDALQKADIVMDNNQLFDTDGGDAMTDYLDAVTRVDSLYTTQR